MLRSLEPPQQPRRLRLVFTDFVLLGAIGFAFLIANDIVLGTNLQQSFVKHGVGLLLAGACALYTLGAGLNAACANHRIRGANGIWLFLVALGVFIVCGSLYARLVLGVRESFLIVGLYILVGYLFLRCLRSDNTMQLVWATGMAGLVFAMAVALETVGMRVADRAVRDTVIHEREFFVIPLIYLLWFTQRLPIWLRYGGALVIALAAVAALKNTPTIVLALTLGLAAWRWQTKRRIDRTNFPRRLLIAYLLMLGVAMLGAAFGYYVLTVRDATPVGNIDFRQHQYGVAWQQFLNSPLYGKAFMLESGIPFDLWYDPKLAGSSLPTHNDVLDLMRGGGMVALLLWLVPVGWVCALALQRLWRAGRARSWSERDDMLGWLLLVNVSAVVVYFFNPVLAKTGLATLVWVHFALLTALVCLIRHEPIS